MTCRHLGRVAIPGVALLGWPPDAGARCERAELRQHRCGQVGRSEDRSRAADPADAANLLRSADPQWAADRMRRMPPDKTGGEGAPAAR